MEKQKDCRVKLSDNSALLFCRKDCTAEDLRHESHIIDRPHTQRRFGLSNRAANMPFRFGSCMELRDVLGKHAMDEHRLLELIEEVPADSIYYHTHSYFLRHAYTQQLYSNDFATWVVLYAQDRVLGERLGVLDPFDFSDIEQLQLIPGVTGFTVNSPEGAGFYTRRLLNEAELMAMLGRQGKEYARHRFLITRHLQEYLGLLIYLQQRARNG